MRLPTGIWKRQSVACSEGAVKLFRHARGGRVELVPTDGAIFGPESALEPARQGTAYTLTSPDPHTADAETNRRRDRHEG